jgi:hypothetical protein
MLFSAAGAFLFKPRSTGLPIRITSIQNLLLSAFLAVIPAVARAQSATTTTLAVSSDGSAATTVASGSVVTLTATVVAGAAPVTVGQVNFCDATAALCSDIHLLGTAQLTSAGAATYKFRPGVGSHSYKAMFLGTPHGATACAGSASSAAALTVTEASRPTATTVVEDNTKNNPDSPYPLTVTVGGTGSTAPTGMVSFLNTSDGNAEVGTATLGGGPSQLSFLNSLNPVPYPQIFPNLIVTGDFNGDGIPDAVAIGDGGVNILLGDGNGGFTPKPLSSTLSGPALAAADLNGDGKLDLAVAGPGNNTGTVQILLGNGDGTFTPVAMSTPTAFLPTSIAVADFNQDGIPDLAVLVPYSETVTIMLGNGDGTFTVSPASPVTGIQPQSIVSGDFNGDGIPDLVVANFELAAASPSGSLTVLLGNGDGTFLQPATNLLLNNTGNPVSMTVGDFNRDGNLDLAVADAFGAIFILIGDGHGGFTPQTPIAGGHGLPRSFMVGDFDQDGVADLAVMSSSDNTIVVVPGHGDGTFSQATTSAVTGDDLGAFASADFNGDGYPDLISANETNLSVFITATEIAMASVSTPLNLPPGLATESIVASYPGDSNYGPSTSLPFAISEQLYVPTVTVTPASSSITTAQALMVTIAVNGGTGNPTPTGSVVLRSGSYTSASWTLSGGSQSINIPAGSLAAGTDTLTVAYTPDATSSSIYSGTTGSANIVVAAPSFALSGTAVGIPAAGTSATSSLTVSPAGGFTGSVALTAAVTSSPAGAVSPPTLSFGSTSPVSITGTSAGTAMLTVTTTVSTSPGVYAITVTGTSGSITATTSIPVTVPIGMAAASVTVTPSLTPITNEQVESVAITVAGGSGQATPTGTVTLASGSYSAQQALAAGAASFSIAAGALSPGTDTLTATYSGDGMYAGAVGTATITVSPVVMAIPSPPSVAPGANATATATLTAGSTYSGTMSLVCALTQSPSGAQSQPTCSLNPASVTLAAGGSATTMLTVKTTAASTSALVRPSRLNPWGSSWSARAGAALAGLLLLGIPFRRRRWPAMLILLWVGVAGLAIGCGGGGGSTSTNPIQATTAGNYVFKVTGTDSSNTNIAVSASVTVTVQ